MAKGKTTIFNPAPLEDLFKGEELLEDSVSLPASSSASWIWNTCSLQEQVLVLDLKPLANVLEIHRISKQKNSNS